MGSKSAHTFAGSKLPQDASPSKKSAPAALLYDPTSARLFLSPAQIGAAKVRKQLLRAALPLFEAGLPQFRIARMVGISAATFSRLLNISQSKGQFARTGLSNCRRLLRLPTARLAPRAASGGRDSDFAGLLKVKMIAARLSQLYLGHRIERRSQSVCIRAALQDLGYCEVVPPLLARRLRIGVQPRTLVDFLRKSFKVGDVVPQTGDQSKN